MVFTPFTAGEAGTPATFNQRFEEMEDYIAALMASGSLTPAIVDWTTLGGAAASISLTGISQAFQSLMLVAMLRTDQAATKSTLVLRLNNDSTDTNYFAYTIQAAGSVVTASQVSGTAGFDMKDMCTAASAPTDMLGLLVVDLLAYTATTPRGMLYRGYCQGSLVTTTELEYHAGGGNYLGASAITRIDLIPGSGNFVAGCHYALYGMP